MTVHDCESSRLALGALVLGALTPAEREQVERHVAQCDRCRTELAELALLPGLLNLVRPDHIPTAEAVDIRLSPRLLETLMAAANEGDTHGSPGVPATTPSVATPGNDRGPRATTRPPQRRDSTGPNRRRSWLVAVGAAAGAAIVAAVVWVVVVTTGPTDHSHPASVTASATDPVAKVAATVELIPATDGTDVAVTITGGPSGEECDLVVVSADGDRDVAKTWTIGGDDYSGGAASVIGHVRFAIESIDRLDLTTDDGVLLTVPLR